MESNAPDCTEQLLQQRLAVMEDLELDSPHGKLSTEQYCEFLALYLLANDLANAKLLWKRIPGDIKSSNELKAIWEVFKAVWTHDCKGIHNTIQAYEWSVNIKKIMSEFTLSVRERYLRLVAHGYTEVKISFLAELLGVGELETCKLIESKGWSVSGAFARPVKTKLEADSVLNNEEHLEKLTQYILFLES
uniref:COP9 signalosome complex subunit 8 n=1 Tax=Ciona intestinalis TaxID=7719 RepID=F6TBA1_CIOIN|nr:COP9 signalosome complex subunit 8-like [Ciona intestinalis]|eukprot:XP_002126361.1 COP9 signalosome complex subunit 8-like [Ciona intestinalis]